MRLIFRDYRLVVGNPRRFVFGLGLVGIPLLGFMLGAIPSGDYRFVLYGAVLLLPFVPVFARLVCLVGQERVVRLFPPKRIALAQVVEFVPSSAGIVEGAVGHVDAVISDGGRERIMLTPPPWFLGSEEHDQRVRETIAGMNVTILSTQLGETLEPRGYRRVGSDGDLVDGDVRAVLEGDRLVWRLVRDGARVDLECRPREGFGDRWYSAGLLSGLLDDDRASGAGFSPAETVVWVRQHLDELEARFGDSDVTRTVRELQQLRRQGARELLE